MLLLQPGSIAAIVLSGIVGLACSIKLLGTKTKKEFNQALIHVLIAQIPLYIVSIVCCFMASLQVVSFGTALFWGLALNVAYNYLVIKGLIIDKK